MNKVILVLIGVLVCTVSYAKEKKWHPPCTTKRVFTEVVSAFVYDFKGYLTKVGDYPVDRRAIKDCKKLGENLATTCNRSGEYWFCVCTDKVLQSDMGMLIIEDKTKK